jgi:hypothetical protein
MICLATLLRCCQLDCGPRFFKTMTLTFGALALKYRSNARSEPRSRFDGNEGIVVDGAAGDEGIVVEGARAAAEDERIGVEGAGVDDAEAGDELSKPAKVATDEANSWDRISFVTRTGKKGFSMNSARSALSRFANTCLAMLIKFCSTAVPMPLGTSSTRFTSERHALMRALWASTMARDGSRWLAVARELASSTPPSWNLSEAMGEQMQSRSIVHNCMLATTRIVHSSGALYTTVCRSCDYACCDYIKHIRMQIALYNYVYHWTTDPCVSILIL